jgi:TIR domain
VPPQKDFFISYNSNDQSWAEWLAWTLEAAGYSVIIDAWDFRAGGNFVLEMDKAIKQSRQTIAVLSQNYLNAEYVHPEWAGAFAKDARGDRQSLLTVRVGDCEPGGLLGMITRIDLMGLTDEAAKERLLEALKERGKPEHPPQYPGFGAVSFPGMTVPQNLPFSGVTKFVGRDDDLIRLHELLQLGEQVAIASIQGMGGIGKTELALQYALYSLQPIDLSRRRLLAGGKGTANRDADFDLCAVAFGVDLAGRTGLGAVGAMVLAELAGGRCPRGCRRRDRLCRYSGLFAACHRVAVSGAADDSIALWRTDSGV